MKHLLLLFTLLCLAPLHAQTNGIEQTSDLVTVPTGGTFFHWYGKPGRSYFVQISDSSDHLVKWNWAPIIESGNDEDISYEVDATAEKGFFRLKYTDQVPGPDETLDTADFDHDGISNIDEITALHPTDPLNADTDGDGLPDGWEITNGLDPNDDGSINPANGPNGDPDTDRVSNANEFVAGTKANDANDFPPQIIQITKGADGHSNTVPYDAPQDPYLGSRHWGPWWITTGYSEETIHDAAVTPDNLKPLLDGITFPATPEAPAGQPAFVVQQTNLALANIFCTSSVNLPTTGGVDTGLTSSRVWIKAPAVAFERKFHFVKVKETTTHSFSANTTVSAFVSAEAVEVVIPANQNLSGPIDLLHVPTGVVGCDITSYESLVQVDIVPDANMAGVIGDVVKSNIAGSTIKHFVTPQKTTELNQDNVELVAAGIDASLFDQLYEWEGGQAGTAANKRKVNRAAAARTEVKIKLKTGGAVAAQMDVWVVWANMSGRIQGNELSPNNDLSFEDFEMTRLGEQEVNFIREFPQIDGTIDRSYGHLFISGIEWKASISPVTMFDLDSDVPDLTEITPKNQNPALTYDGGRAYYTHWDVPRSRKATRIQDGATVLQETEWTIDDDVNSTRDEDPYEQSSDRDESAEVFSIDSPGADTMRIEDFGEPVRFIPDCSSYEVKQVFQEWARFRLGDKWFDIADKKDWYARVKIHKVSNEWQVDDMKIGIGIEGQN